MTEANPQSFNSNQKLLTVLLSLKKLTKPCKPVLIDTDDSNPQVLPARSNPMSQTTKNISNTLKPDLGFATPLPPLIVKEEEKRNIQRGKKESVLWEFEGDNGFEFYKKKDCELIEAAYEQGDSTIKIKMHGKEYEIDFGKMAQTNTATNYFRRVGRILLNDEALDFQLITWKVMLDSSGISAYDDDINKAIEEAYNQKKATFITVIKGKKYIIDLVKMKQINEATQYERGLLREAITIPSSALWLWLDDNNKYSGYSKESNKTIEDQFQRKVKKFNLTILQTNYEIDFGNFTQTDLHSNKARRIIRVPLEVLLDSEVWEWEDDKGFVPYESSKISAIEDAYKNKQQILSFTKNTYHYTIDLHKMVQIDNSTNKSKSIRRIPPVPPLPKPSANPASVSQVALGTLWECESDKGYVKYPLVFCDNLNAAFNSGNNTYFYNYKGTPFVIDFTKMVQINQNTQRARRIRNYIAPGALPKISMLPGCKLMVLDSFAPDYKEVKGLFDKTMSGRYKNITITLLINSHTKKRYDNCVGLLTVEGGAPLKTLLLFHGTSSVDPKKIYDGYYENFDVAHAKAGLWGKGVYFAADASYSCNWYSHTKGNGVHSIIVAEVAVGNYYDYGYSNDINLLHPPNLPNDNYKRYDSVSGITGGTRVYIIYSSNQAYSKYLITYSV